MKTKEIPIDYIEFDEKIKNIRNAQSEEAIGRYMEKYESGTSKAISVKEIDRQHYILIDGHHRIEAIKRLKKRKIEAEILDVSDKELYGRAVEKNVEHGVSLTKEEEKDIMVNFIEEGKTHEEMSKVFHITREAITKRIDRDPILKKVQSTKSGISTINEILDGKDQKEISGIYGIAQQTVSQRWNNWLDEIRGQYNSGTTKQEIIFSQEEKGINLTTEKLNELIEEDLNKIIFGDCLKEIPKLDNELIDCMIIDPPYGIDFQSNYKKEKFDKIKGDNKEAFELLDNSLKLVQPKLKKDSHIYIFTSWKVYDKIKQIIEKHFVIKNCLIWNKNNIGMGDLDGNYADKYEMIVFATQGKRKLYSDKRPFNVLDYDRVENSEHPTQKPKELLKELIINSTKEGQVILDYFAGSGSTLIASKEVKRKWLGIEKEEEYVDIIKSRTKKYVLQDNKAPGDKE